MEIVQGTVDHQETDKMEVSQADEKQNFGATENDLTESKSTDCISNENSNKENVNNDDNKPDEGDQQSGDTESQHKSESQQTSILNSATFPSMFSSSFSSLKSFAKRSLSTNETAREANP